MQLNTRVWERKIRGTDFILTAMKSAILTMQKCPWALADPLSEHYHDTQWGVPVHDDALLFEMLILEGAQAGLSWVTVLKKRAAYQQAFDQFDAAKIAVYDADKLASLMQNTGLIRNRLKMAAVVSNARAFLRIQQEMGSFDRYLWSFVNYQVIHNQCAATDVLPTCSPEAHSLSKDLKRRGFKFVGPTICYAYMQAVGMVNDHTVECYRYRQLSGTAL